MVALHRKKCVREIWSIAVRSGALLASVIGCYAQSTKCITVMVKRITFNTDDDLTINSIDRYAESNGMSRSKVICELLRSTAPILDFVTYQNRITQEVESRLFSMRFVTSKRSSIKMTLLLNIFTLCLKSLYSMFTQILLKAFSFRQYLNGTLAIVGLWRELRIKLNPICPRVIVYHAMFICA